VGPGHPGMLAALRGLPPKPPATAITTACAAGGAQGLLPPIALTLADCGGVDLRDEAHVSIPHNVIQAELLSFPGGVHDGGAAGGGVKVLCVVQESRGGEATG